MHESMHVGPCMSLVHGPCMGPCTGSMHGSMQDRFVLTLDKALTWIGHGPGKAQAHIRSRPGPGHGLGKAQA